MQGNGKKKEEAKELKEKKTTSCAETKADDKASGQQGLASAMASHASYGQSMVTKRQMKAEIQKEFWAQNKLTGNAEVAKYSENCYRVYKQKQEQRCNTCLEVFGRDHALAPQHSCFSHGKHLQEQERCDTQGPPHSVSGHSTDYDTEGDEQIRQVLAHMAALPPVPSLQQAPPTSSRHRHCRSSHHCHRCHTPLVGQAPVCSGRLCIRRQHLMSMSQHTQSSCCYLQFRCFSIGMIQTKRSDLVNLQRDCSQPCLVFLRQTTAGPCAPVQLKVAQEILVATEDQVPADATRPTIEPLLQLISLLPTLQVSPEPNPLLAPTEMPTEIMELQEAAVQKQAEGAEDAEMQEAPEPEAEAEADAEADDKSDKEDSEDMTTYYFHVTEGQSHYDETCLSVLWSYQDHEQPL